MNISGVLVYSVPRQVDVVVSQLTAIEGVEVHGEEHGKIVVTVEKENIAAMADQVTQFQNMPGIMSVAMVYQHSEDDEALNAEELLQDEPSVCGVGNCNEFIPKESQS